MLQRVELEMNVYEAAIIRTREIINTHDHIFVSFSGGKDSLVALSIVEEVYKQMGLSDKINVIFRDEEIIPDDVVDFVQSKYHSGKYNFGYFCLQLKSEKYIH